MTPNEMKLSALRKLKVIGAHEEASPEDFELMGEKYAALLELLSVLELADWQESEDIPEAAQIAVISMLAAISADEFGVPEPRASALKQEGAIGSSPYSYAERQLRAVQAAIYVPKTLKTQYY